MRYRTVALADGAAQNWNGGNTLCAALCARAVVETVAQLFYVKNGVAVALKLEELSQIDRIVEQGTSTFRGSLAALIIRLDNHRRDARRRGLTPLAEDLGEALAALRGLLLRPTTFVGSAWDLQPV